MDQASPEGEGVSGEAGFLWVFSLIDPQEVIAFELLAPENAAGKLDRIEEAAVSLEDFPDRYRLYEDEPWHSRGLRVLPVDNYVIFYIVKDDTRVVTIIRIMYCGRNIDEQLNLFTDYDEND